MNKTKIIATIGPASSDKDILRKLILNGMDVVRLNLSHASHDFCRDIVKKIKELNEELGTYVSIMIDLQGPDVQIHKFIGGKATLKKDDKIRIYMDELLGDNTKFSVNYPGLINDVKYESVIKINDGLIELKVIDKGSDYLLCEVLNDGVVENHKSLNFPGIKLSLPFLSKKDRNDIRFAHEINADFLALSFVSSSDDILEVNDILIELGNDHIGIIAKIENEHSLDEIDDIIRVSEGIMIARGDLGVEIPMEKVPGIQKMIISKCHSEGKISIVATEMLSSMETGVRPTRAEVSDVANAVIDSVDAVMLSGETTIGLYPIETLKMMERIISSAEEDINYIDLLEKAVLSEKQDTTGALARSVTEIACCLKCKAVVVPTNSGYTARKMSKFRPSCPIIAVSPDINTVKSLGLHFGVHAVLIDELNSIDSVIKKSRDIVNELIDIDEGDRIIITGGYPFKEIKHTNFMKIEEF